jgi:hypothetical protein
MKDRNRRQQKLQQQKNNLYAAKITKQIAGSKQKK